jgi:hypothetical protein
MSSKPNLLQSIILKEISNLDCEIQEQIDQNSAINRQAEITKKLERTIANFGE